MALKTTCMLYVVILLSALFGATSSYSKSLVINQEDFVAQKKMQKLPDGINQAYVEFGNPSAPTLVLLHGYTDTSRAWTPILPYLAKHYHVVAFDLRGHGNTSAPPCCYTFQDMAYDIKLGMDNLGIKKALVVGHSLGTFVAQMLAEMWPEKVSDVVLISTSSNSFSVTAPDTWLGKGVASLTDPIDLNSQFMKDFNYNPNPIDPVFKKFLMEEAVKTPLRVWKQALDTLNSTDTGRLLYKIKAPVLIIHGEKDQFFDEAGQKSIRALLPKAKYIEYKNMGHNPYWENPKLVATDIEAFDKQARQ